MRSASCMFPKIPSVRGTADDHISKELEDADDGENNEHRQPNHVAVAHLIAVADSKVADAARADRAGNGRNAHKADEGNHRHAGDARNTFPQIDAENDLPR